MNTNIKTALFSVAFASVTFLGASHAATEAGVVGSYRTNNETEFNFDLTISKDGKAVYSEFDPMGDEKPFIHRGKWVLEGSTLTLDFAKKGRYVYAVTDQLTWANFGCKGASFGLAIKSTPKAKSSDSNYFVFRKSDLQKVDRCNRL